MMHSLISCLIALTLISAAWGGDDSWGQKEEEEDSTYCKDNGLRFGNFPDPDSCEGFIVCNNGFTVLMDCAKGTAFNSKLGLCVLNRYSDCYGDGSWLDGGNRDWDSNGSDDGDNSYDRDWSNSNDNDNNNRWNGNTYDRNWESSEEEEEESTYCQDNGLSFGVYPDPDNCEGYIVCNGGFTVLMDCAEGTFYNSAKEVCVFKEYSDCYGNGDVPTWEDGDWDNSDSRDNSNDGDWSDSNDNDNNNRWSGNTYDRNWESSEEEKDSTYCQDNGYSFGVYPDPDNCEGYIVCNGGFTVLMDCAEGTFYNSAKEVCVFKEYSDCYGNGDVPTWEDGDWDNSDSRDNSNDGDWSDSNDNDDNRWNGNWESSEEEEDSTYCQDNGYSFGVYPDPDNCEGYIVCNGGFTVLMDCPEGTAFNCDKEICVFKEYSDCYGNGEVPNWEYGGWGSDKDIYSNNYNTVDRNRGNGDYDNWGDK